MEECAGIAEVIRVTKHPVIEIAECVKVGGSTSRQKDEPKRRRCVPRVPQPDDDEPICGEDGCQICPTKAQFAQWQVDQYRRDRQAANELYQRLGFAPRETNVYRYELSG